MKPILTCICLALFLSLPAAAPACGQAAPPADTTGPSRLPVNSGFDVIVKKNGDILYGIVKEVGQQLIRYQRTDIPDGPIYTVPRGEVFAISYRNQVKDILGPMKDTTAAQAQPAMHDTAPAIHDTVIVHDTAAMPSRHPHKLDSLSKAAFFRKGNVRAGLGFLRSYTRVGQAGQYASSINFPAISIAYDVRYRDRARVGIQASFGPHKFTGQAYSSYDSAQTNVALKEDIFMLDAYGRYNLPYRTAKLQPYAMGGIGIHSSHINSEYHISFINDANHALVVKSGTNSVGIGIIARIGTEYYINNKLSAFGDVGIGASVLSFGICARAD